MTSTDTPPHRRFPRALSILLKICASGTLLYFVISKINVAEAVQRITLARHSSLAVALLLATCAPSFLALRWWVLARPIISLGEAITYTWIGLFYGIILPGGLSGDIAKGSIMALRNVRVRHAAFAASILTDRIVGFTVMLFFFCASCLLIHMTAVSPKMAHFALSAAGFGALGLGALIGGCTKPFQRVALAILARVRWFGGEAKFMQFAEVTYAYLKEPRRLWTAAALSVCGHCLIVLVYLALLSALSIHLGLIPTFALYSIFSVLAMAPISFAGVGVRDWFAIGFFSVYGLPAESAVAFAWLCLTVAVLQASIGGLWQLVLVTASPPPLLKSSK